MMTTKDSKNILTSRVLSDEEWWTLRERGHMNNQDGQRRHVKTNAMFKNKAITIGTKLKLLIPCFPPFALYWQRRGHWKTSKDIWWKYLSVLLKNSESGQRNTSMNSEKNYRYI